MKALVFTGVGAGRPPVMRLDRLQYVYITPLTVFYLSHMEIAVWWICRSQGIPLQAHRLQRRFMVAEFRRIHRRR